MYTPNSRSLRSTTAAGMAAPPLTVDVIRLSAVPGSLVTAQSAMAMKAVIVPTVKLGEWRSIKAST